MHPEHVLDQLLHMDCCSLLVGTTIVLAVGSKVLAGQDAIHRWGLRLGGLGFLLCLTYGYTRCHPRALAHLAVAALAVGGLVTGASWILLAIGVAVLGKPVGWIWDKVHDWQDACRRREQERQATQRDDERRLREQEEERCLVPERECRQREAEARAQAEADAARRRTEARARCEIDYYRSASLLQERFPKAAFDAFVSTYLNDNLPPERVEHYATQLQALIEHQAQAALPAPAPTPPPPPPPFPDRIAQIQREHEERLAALQALPADDDETQKLKDRAIEDEFERYKNELLNTTGGGLPVNERT